MQTSFYSHGFDMLRISNFAWQSSASQRYRASGESLDALRARTTPIDITNPYTTSHASCANAFLATAITVGDRYSEMSRKLPSAEAISFKGIMQPAALVAVTETETLSPPFTHVAPKVELLDQLELSSLIAPVDIDVSPLLQLQSVALPDAVQEHLAEETAQVSDTPSSKPQPLSAVASTSESNEILSAEYQEEGDIAIFSGSAPANTLVEFYIDDVLVGSVESDEEGSWHFTPPSALPPAEHTFSAVVMNDQGGIRSKIDLSFTSKIAHDAVIAPIADTIDDQIDNALIELAMEEDVMPIEFATIDFSTKLLDGWLEPVSNVSAPQILGETLVWEEPAAGDIIWH